MPGLGYITLGELNLQGSAFSFDESVCGMLFDTSMYYEPFNDYVQLEGNFGDGQTCLIHNLEEAEDLGLTDAFMNGVPYYHIKQFYDYVGADAKLYITFADCILNDKSDFGIIQDIQQAANGKIFQLGIWTEQCIWKSTSDGQNGQEIYGFTGLIGEIEGQAEALAGVVNKTNSDNLPLSVILNACTTKLDDADGYVIDHKRLPNALSLNCPKISVIFGQNGTEEVHAIQAGNHNYTPVGFLGIALACLCLASAEMNIAYVDKFNLNKDDNLLDPELGFGDIVAGNYNPISELNTVRRNILSEKGYILPTVYKSKESGVYFSNDQTLSERDFSTISLNRIAHKCRRVIRSVMFAYVNGNISLDPSTGAIAAIDQTKIVNEIVRELDANMVNPLGQEQIGGRYVVFDDTKDILATDELSLDCHIVTVGSNMAIDVQEAYVLDE